MSVNRHVPGCSCPRCAGAPCSCAAIGASRTMQFVSGTGLNYFGPMTRVADLGSYVTALAGMCGWVSNCFLTGSLLSIPQCAGIVVAVAPTPGTIPATFTFGLHGAAASSTCPQPKYDAHAGLAGLGVVDGTTINPLNGTVNSCSPVNVGTTRYSMT